MYRMLDSFIFLISIGLSISHPFIIDSFPDHCIFNSNRSFSSQLLKIDTKYGVLYYTLCGYVPANINCGVNVTACLKNKHDNSSTIMGRKLLLDSDENLYLDDLSSSFCKGNPKKKYGLSIKFDINVDIKDQYLEMKNECDYVIHRIRPDIQPSCTTKIYESLIDLRPLRDLNKIFRFNSEEKKFSLAFCKPNNDCNKNEFEGISSCVVINNDIIPLSRADSEMVYYNEDKNELSIHGSYKGKRKQDNKHFELVLKCDWDGTSNKMQYKKVQQQGKRYRFEMETTFGCIKTPSHCEITDKFFIYNITGLYNNQGYVKVSNVTDGEIYLNICGPLKFDGPENNCSAAYSQVCSVHNGVYVNKGSISSKLKIDDDVKITFSDGAKCKENYMYSTHITFLCSGSEQGPTFVRSTECEIFIEWSTPQACPIYDTTQCNHLHSTNHNCVINQDGYKYDLSGLTLYNESYEIQDISNKSIKYFLNVCSPVIDSDAACMKDSMVLMKDLDQNNLKYKVKSLGKMSDMYVANEQIIIKALSGSYCEPEGDYNSIIKLICSKKEELPKLVHKTQCTFEFQWKTHKACPVADNSCTYQDPSNNFLLDFTKVNKTLVNINIDKSYKFDLCKTDYTECSSPVNCTRNPLKTLLRHNSKTYLDLILPRQCNSKTDFNMVSFELVCDRIVNNEHFSIKGITNCTIMMDLYTNLICTKEDSLWDNTKYDVIKENDNKNCSVNNPITGYKFFISSLQLDIPFSDCPNPIFNKHSSSVLFVYSNDTACEEENGYGKYIQKIVLQCSKIKVNQTEATSCSTTYKYTGPEFCKLFETSILENYSTSYAFNTVLGIIVPSIIGGVVLISMCIFLFFKVRSRRISLYDSIYQKDADL